MKESDKSDKIQAIIDEWLVNYIKITLGKEKTIKWLKLLFLLTKKAGISFRSRFFMTPVFGSSY